ncbi:MAG: LamG domain-containing protein, partial [Verrucomicrobiota bacterium]
LAGLDAAYDLSLSGSHHIHVVFADTGAFDDDSRVYVDGSFVAAEATATGDGENWGDFDFVSINNAGNYLLGVSFAPVVSLAWNSGGFPSPVLLWLVLFPMVAIMVANDTSGILWGVASLITVVAMFVADKSGYAFGRKPQYYKWTTPIEHHLYSTSREALAKQASAPIPAKTRPKAKKAAPGSFIQVVNSNSLDPTGKPLTVEAWVNPQAGNGVVIARGGPLSGYALTLDRGRPIFHVRNAKDVHTVSGPALRLNTWNHLAGVLTEGKMIRLYVNGEKTGEKEYVDFLTAIPKQDTEIGSDEDGSVGNYPEAHLFKGLIDEVRIYHGTVTEAEIRRHAEGPKQLGAAGADLVLHLSFDDGKAKDLSGKKNHGTMGTVKSVPSRMNKAMQFAGVTKNPRRRRGKIPVQKAFEYTWNKLAMMPTGMTRPTM